MQGSFGSVLNVRGKPAGLGKHLRSKTFVFPRGSSDQALKHPHSCRADTNFRDQLLSSIEVSILDYFAYLVEPVIADSFAEHSFLARAEGLVAYLVQDCGRLIVVPGKASLRCRLFI